MTPTKIAAIRQQAGLNKAQLARILGQSDRYMRMLEAGERVPSRAVVIVMEMIERGELPKRYLDDGKIR